MIGSQTSHPILSLKNGKNGKEGKAQGVGRRESPIRFASQKCVCVRHEKQREKEEEEETEFSKRQEEEIGEKQACCKDRWRDEAMRAHLSLSPGRQLSHATSHKSSSLSLSCRPEKETCRQEEDQKVHIQRGKCFLFFLFIVGEMPRQKAKRHNVAVHKAKNQK